MLILAAYALSGICHFSFFQYPAFNHSCIHGTTWWLHSLEQNQYTSLLHILFTLPIVYSPLKPVPSLIPIILPSSPTLFPLITFYAFTFWLFSILTAHIYFSTPFHIRIHCHSLYLLYISLLTTFARHAITLWSLFHFYLFHFISLHIDISHQPHIHSCSYIHFYVYL